MKILMVLAIAFTLTGCATTQSAINPQKVRPVVISQCPELRKYRTADLKKAASELNLLPANSQIAELLTDYNKLRDACRILAKRMRTYYYK
jgi:uncharacterized protein YceK